MVIGRINLRHSHFYEFLAIVENINSGIVTQALAALDNNALRTGSNNLLCCFLNLLYGSNLRHICKISSFHGVRCNDVAARHQQLFDRFCCIRHQNQIAALADHNRVDNHVLQIVFINSRRNQLYQLAAAQHTGLHRIDANAFNRCHQLLFHQIQRQREDAVLPGSRMHSNNAGQSRHTINAQLLHSFNIRFHTGAAACIAAGNSQCFIH